MIDCGGTCDWDGTTITSSGTGVGTLAVYSGATTSNGSQIGPAGLYIGGGARNMGANLHVGSTNDVYSDPVNVNAGGDPMTGAVTFTGSAPQVLVVAGKENAQGVFPTTLFDFVNGDNNYPTTKAGCFLVSGSTSIDWTQMEYNSASTTGSVSTKFQAASGSTTEVDANFYLNYDGTPYGADGQAIDNTLNLNGAGTVRGVNLTTVYGGAELEYTANMSFYCNNVTLAESGSSINAGGDLIVDQGLNSCYLYLSGGTLNQDGKDTAFQVGGTAGAVSIFYVSGYVTLQAGTFEAGIGHGGSAPGSPDTLVVTGPAGATTPVSITQSTETLVLFHDSGAVTDGSQHYGIIEVVGVQNAISGLFTSGSGVDGTLVGNNSGNTFYTAR